MTVETLIGLLSKAPKDCTVKLNQLGNLIFVVPGTGDYIGYLDMRKPRIYIFDFNDDADIPDDLGKGKP